jgi:1-acyl-sn-glycerol-3-phosphate acyltransferase
MNKVVSWFCRIFVNPIVNFCFIKEVKGSKNIPKRNFILASNHQSHLDWIASGCICVPRRLTYLGQVDRYTGPLGLGRSLLYFIAGVIPVNRKDKVSKRIALEKAIEALKIGDILVIYPEGTRSRTGKIQAGRWGIAKIYLKSGVPILPMAIKGTFELFPPSGKLKIKRIVKINIGQPLYFEKEKKKAAELDCNSEEYKYLLQKITDKVMEEIARLYNEP